MRTLEDLLLALQRMDIEPSEIPLSRDEWAHFIRKAQDIIAAEKEPEDE